MKNEINIKYKINKDEESINIFGEQFIINNINICKYKYKNKEYNLSKQFDLKNFDKSKDILEIKLIGIKNVTNMSQLFHICKNLISIPDIWEWDTSNITDMSYAFSYCKSLISFPDLSKWNTKKVKNFNFLFGYCESLKSLPDISNWDTSNATDMKCIFWGCKLLISLPDISKWIKLDNFKVVNNIFFELTYKNNKNKIKILGKEFIDKNKDKGSIIYNNYEFELKEYFDIDISDNNKNTIKFILCLSKNINDISYLFKQCYLLITIEYYNINYEIEKNKKSKKRTLENDSFNFYESYNESLSEISEKSNTYENENTISSSFSELIDISFMFYGCNSLISIPDISKWNTYNVKNMSYMFYGCKSLLSIPDLSKWDISNVKYMDNMFEGCDSLISSKIDIPSAFIKNLKEKKF